MVDQNEYNVESQGTGPSTRNQGKQYVLVKKTQKNTFEIFSDNVFVGTGFTEAIVLSWCNKLGFEPLFTQ